MIGTESALRKVPLLARLPAEQLEALGRRLIERRVAAGEWILREGEPATSMFIIRRGHAEVVDEGPPERLIRVLRRGAVVGELALLTGGTRSASARARQDVDLLELDRSAFEQLILEAPSFALGLVRTMGAQLAATRGEQTRGTPPRTITVLGLDVAAPVAEVADSIAAGLRKFGSVALLREGDLNAIEQAERDADRVVMGAGPADDDRDEWTNLSLAEADVVLAVTTGVPSPAWMRRNLLLTGCELLVFGPRLADGALESFRPRELQVVADPSARREALESLSRRLAGRSVGIVLSGGGARALAHLGVLEELDAAGIRLDRIAGVSLGSLVAASAAAGFTHEEMYERFSGAFVEGNPTNDYAPPAYSLIRGHKARRLIAAAFGELRIEELPRRFFSLSVDLISHETILHRTGRIMDAVYPSMAIPGVFPPVATPDGRLLVDGGVLDNLPVATMSRTGEGPVIGVDVGGKRGDFRKQHPPLVNRMLTPVRRALTGSEAEIPRIGETIIRTVAVGSIDSAVAAQTHADLAITPAVDEIGLMDWKMFPRMRELGRRAVRQALEADPERAERLRA
ncbi:MAG TPA: patatin-like phospholipase family protein [Solirubrobacteraceae bacterium]